jgi:4'-phosphopantetheinyl transferase
VIPELERDETHLWRIPLVTPLPDALRDVLAPDERATMQGFSRGTDAVRFATGRAVLRLLAGRYTGAAPRSIVLDRTCPYCQAPHGKPRVSGAPELDASVSGSGDLVAIAASRSTTVGLDIEAVSAARLAGMAALVLAPGEPMRTPREALQLWCCKEAILKATGHGLVIDPRTLVLGGGPRDYHVVAAPRDQAQLTAFTSRVVTMPAGYVGALAQVRETVVRELDLSPTDAAAQLASS